jgi:hypothetical protein
MLIGISGKPSSGKSTFFSAATLLDVPISARPFTTIDPNKGITYIRVKCPCVELGVKCNPQNSQCDNGVRLIPINIIDLAGLVPGAHEGRGLGNKFLDDVRSAEVLIQVVDVSGKTDAEGVPCEHYDPAEEVKFLEREVTLWISGIIKRGWNKIKGKNIEALSSLLTGLKINESQIEHAAKNVGVSTESINWNDEEILEFSKEVRKIAMPIIIAANKIDLPGAHENYMRLKEKYPDKIIIPTYAEGELALRKAAQKNIIKYTPGDKEFEIIGGDERQKAALLKIKKIMEIYGGTGVQQTINAAVFEQLKLIIVYPVSDEHKFTDNKGNVLPDAIPLRKGATVLQLAEKIHSDLAKSFIFAIDAKKKMRVSKDHILNDGDVIRIVAGKG